MSNEKNKHSNNEGKVEFHLTQNNTTNKNTSIGNNPIVNNYNYGVDKIEFNLDIILKSLEELKLHFKKQKKELKPDEKDVLKYIETILLEKEESSVKSKLKDFGARILPYLNETSFSILKEYILKLIGETNV